ncbi:MAG: molecular chaperone TorD family protein [bacterium]|nr:molecular chaperone TorD family protein [bacterium]
MYSTSESSEPIESQSGQLLAAANLSRLLADVFWEPLLLDASSLGHLRQAASSLGPNFLQAVLVAEREQEGQSVQELRLLYAKLFLGPFELMAAPYASVYLEGDEAFSGNTRDYLMDLYGRGGFRLPAKAGDLPDHLAVELEFVYLMLARYLQFGDEAALGLAQEMAEHMASWLPQWQRTLVLIPQAKYYYPFGDLALSLPPALLAALSASGAWESNPAGAGRS